MEYDVTESREYWLQATKSISSGKVSSVTMSKFFDVLRWCDSVKIVVLTKRNFKPIFVLLLGLVKPGVVLIFFFFFVGASDGSFSISEIIEPMSSADVFEMLSSSSVPSFSPSADFCGFC